MILSVPKILKDTVGVQRTEGQFLLFGWLFGFAFGVVLFATANLTGEQEATRFLPFFPLVMNSFVAYGIATRRILNVSVIVQRVIAYTLMALYLTAVYILVQKAVAALFFYVIPDPLYLSYLAAAVVTALSVVPAHGWMKTVSHRLFAAANLLDVNVVLEQAARLFQEILTEAELAEKFSGLVMKSFGAAHVALLRPDREGVYRQSYPELYGEAGLRFDPDAAILSLLRKEHEAFTTDTLHRMRPDALVTGALRELESSGASLAIGSFMRQEMKAVLILPPKKNGHIYDLRDQRALQLLCDQFAVALENSNLYTAVQNGKIYNDILLDSLTSGIVAVDANRTVTIFNQRAQKLIGLPESAVAGHPMSVLPPALMSGLDSVLKTGAAFRDKDVTIDVGGEELPLRVSGARFNGHTGRLLGALLVFNDMTLLKKMEEQIRRTDRLSSIGTLSAGMAHEIKNPLVTIKTFTQLLPEQYKEEDFRGTFFDLVGQEVKRIDTIVNRLLNFARPAKAALKPVSLHEIVENSIRLVEQQLAQSEVRLERHLQAKRHIIEADAEQINQTLINFFLNAVHAMEEGGTLTVRTSLVQPPYSQITGEPADPVIQLDIRDTGCGIPRDQLDKIFDPFFTTKEDGVGLGLSVSHGIIQEHNGTIDVESEEGKGTVFHIQFPLLKTQEKKEP